MTNPEKPLAEDLERALADTPMLDVHTHLVGGRLGARGLHDILLYHMVVSDLYAAGCPSGSRLTQYPLWPSEQVAHPTSPAGSMNSPRQSLVLNRDAHIEGTFMPCLSHGLRHAGRAWYDAVYQVGPLCDEPKESGPC